MCTVTFVPLQEGVLLTHSRDEKKMRSRAIPPRAYTIRDKRLAFPRDGQSGGTWIGMNEHGAAAVLLNGAFFRHTPMPPYRKSRGLILLDVLVSEDPKRALDQLNLEGIEPFTLITWYANRLTETRWDGSIRFSRPLPAAGVHIWSSVTLYDAPVIDKRKAWFETFMSSLAQPTAADVMRFHLLGGDGDRANSILMNRNDALLTLSITQIELTAAAGNMTYQEMDTGRLYEQQMPFVSAPVISG